MVPLRAQRRWIPGLALLALAAGHGPLEAQRIVGRVLEEGGGGPVAGAMVRLVNDTGATGSGWLTAADGRFRLEAPAGGTYEIRVERIGFATVVIGGVSVADNGIASIDVTVETEPITLEGLQVEAEAGRCRIDESGGMTQVVWDEARKALAAATWTEAQVNLRFVVSVWDRQISPRTSQILFEEREQRETLGANSVQSLPPEELVRDGYVQSHPGFLFYYAPDAAVLLSDEFLDTHCFRVVEDQADGSAFVGLRFEPDRERDRPDVEGVIWLDEASGRLDRVEFSYTGLRIAGANRARGEVRFAQVADGRWIVREWFIQAPMASGRVGTPGAIRRGNRSLIHEVGNRVELVEGAGFSWTPDIVPATVSGLVFDSVSGGVLPGAEVRIAGRAARSNSDLSGRFELHDVHPGMHRLTFSHPRLDSLGVTPGWTTIVAESGEELEVDLAVPRWETLLALSCGEQGAGALVGVVRSREGLTIGGATVEVLDALGPDSLPITDISDQYGAYVLCDAPEGVTRVRASRGGSRSEVAEASVLPESFVQIDLTLPPPPVRPLAVPGVLRPAIVGTVLARESRQPLQDVEVRLLDEDGEVVATDLSTAEGEFRMVLDDGLPVAYLSVARLGYTGAVSEALDLSEGTRRVEILLPSEAIEIEPVIVIVDGRVPRLEREGFYARATSIPGLFLRRDDIDAVAPARTSDLLERAPGVRSWTDPLSGDLRRRIVFTRLTLAGGDRCYPSLYVDGDMVRLGGSRNEPGAPTIEGIEPPADEDVPSLDELIPPHEIEAVEMYPTPGQVPQRFTGLGTRCGVIVVWTRRGGDAR